jgi:HEPN domain-containing protein
MKPGREAGLRWLRQAEHDLAVTKRLQDHGDYSDARFMAEQASQKALKAFLLAHGERSVPIHSVAQLAEGCSRIDPDFKEHIAPARARSGSDIDRARSGSDIDIFMLREARGLPSITSPLSVPLRRDPLRA